MQLVLHLLHRFIRIRARRKAQGYRCLARGTALRGHVHQVIKTRHVLLDNLRDGIFQRLCRGARIVRRDTHVGGREVGVLLNRKGSNRQDTRQTQQDCKHPGKNGAIDEKIRH